MCIRVALSLGILALMIGSGLAAQTPATLVGPEDQARQISVTVWLNLHNKATLDAMVPDMYDKSSPNYHQFLTMKDFNLSWGTQNSAAASLACFSSAEILSFS